MEVIRGRIPHAVKTVIYGVEGIGKSTFASHYPDPLFIDTEGGTAELDVARLPAPSSWQMIKDEVQYVIDHPSCCRTLVLDTADWAEEMCRQSVCSKAQMDGLEAFGYGRGYKYVAEEFGTLVNLLSDIIEKGVNVVVIAHAAMRKFEQPDEMGAYDRWEMKLINTQKCSNSAMLKEWADMVLFATYKTHTVAVDKEGKKKKAMGAGRRIMYTTHHSCWDAKNRYGLPDEMDFNYDGIREIVDGATREAKKEPAKKAVRAAAKPAPVEEVAPPAEAAGEAGAKAPEPDPLPVEPEPAEPAENPHVNPDWPPDGRKIGPPDPRIPKALRDLMIENDVHEWDIQDAVQARGYLPSDIPIWEYDEKAGEGFIEGALIGAWDQVLEVIKEMREKEEIPFN